MKTIVKTNLFALLAVLLGASVMLAYAAPASANEQEGPRHHRGGGDYTSVSVSVSNTATVQNTVEVEAETGENDADGGDGDEGGDGGDAEGKGNNNGGAGGNGGNGGEGGSILTGDALAGLSLWNDVNTTNTNVETCGCDEDPEPQVNRRGHRRGGDKTRIEVSVTNGAEVGNDVEVEAETGDNDADGGDGDEGGDGGDATVGNDDDEQVQKRHRRHHRRGNGENNGGNGGRGGNGAIGGIIATGAAASAADVANVVNKTLTRIRG